MKSTILLIFMGILMLLALFSLEPASAEEPRYLDVYYISMDLDGPDARFTVYYELDIIAQLYVLFLGSGNIEPTIEEIFYDFNDKKVISIRKNYAIVEARNVSYMDPEQKGALYFHDSHPLGTNVETLEVKFPSGVSRTFSDVLSTPNVFFEVS